jgi:DNA alkylation repair enzyme
VDDPAQVDEAQMETWLRDFDSWDLCDQTCSNLFGRTAYAFPKARAWARRHEEFSRRAGFVLIAERAAHDRVHDDSFWVGWFPTIRRGARDDRNYVKKAVSWSLRQIGKRDEALRTAAIEEAELLLGVDARSARWIARDVLRELQSEAVKSRLRSTVSRPEFPHGRGPRAPPPCRSGTARRLSRGPARRLPARPACRAPRPAPRARGPRR